MQDGKKRPVDLKRFNPIPAGGGGNYLHTTIIFYHFLAQTFFYVTDFAKKINFCKFPFF